MMGFRLAAIFVAVIAISLIFITPAFSEYSVEQYLGIKYATMGKFSPDEKWVAYLSNESGSYQIWRISIEGGTPKQLTDFEGQVRNFAYSPTKDQILFIKDDGGNENYQLYMVNGDGSGLEKLTDAKENRFNMPLFSPDGTHIAYTANIRDKRFFDIHVMNLETRQTRLVRKVNAMNEVLQWSPKGDRLVVSTLENNYNNNIYMLEIETGKHKLLSPHKGWATYDQVVWPKDRTGRKLFYLISDQGETFRKLFRFKLKKGKLEALDSAPWDSQNLCMSENGRVMGYTLNTKGYSQLVLIDMKKNKYWANPRIPKGVIKSLALSKDGNTALFTFSSALYPTDLWIYEKTTNTVRRLTNSSTSGIDPKTFVEPHLVAYLGSRNLEIPAYLYLPNGAKQDGTLPCLLYVHGGPESQERPDFSPLFQYFLSRGFVILTPNVRGSSGYGKQYLALDNKAGRIDAVIDAALGIKWLKRAKYIDGSRVGVFGGSYGGFMTLALLTEEPRLFAAGASIVGISNFVTFLERTHPARRSIREAEYGSLQTDKEILRMLSPVHKITKIKAALMIIQGANDPRVPRFEADQTVEKAKEAGVKVDYLLYEDEGHGLAKLKNRLDAYSKMARFFETHLGEKPKDEVLENSPAPSDDAPAVENGADVGSENK